jgi:hypothetical protein
MVATSSLEFELNASEMQCQTRYSSAHVTVERVCKF